MNILVFAANWYNRGDESAIRAMVDEIRDKYPLSNIKIHFGSMSVSSIPYEDIEIIPRFGNVQRRYILNRFFYKISVSTQGKINLMPATRAISKENNRKALDSFVAAVKWCDLAIYAPGGPNIGDLYRTYSLLDCLDIIQKNGKPYVFFAPSMGPFRQYKRRIAKLLNKADIVCFRENISAEYVKQLAPEVKTDVTLDSAFQHEIDTELYDSQLEEYTDLKKFLEKYDRVVGITITDLQWHSKYSTEEIKQNIKISFEKFIGYLRIHKYGVLFIPQLFGAYSDKGYMSQFVKDNCFVVDDQHDCYFQQYLISKLYAVVGMRYHSNIFSAKMAVPFVSVAYEQKMKGFTEKVGLKDFCFPIEALSADMLKSYFNRLEENYTMYKNRLIAIHSKCQKESFKTTQYVIDLIEKKGLE